MGRGVVSAYDVICNGGWPTNRVLMLPKKGFLSNMIWININFIMVRCKSKICNFKAALKTTLRDVFMLWSTLWEVPIFLLRVQVSSITWFKLTWKVPATHGLQISVLIGCQSLTLLCNHICQANAFVILFCIQLRTGLQISKQFFKISRHSYKMYLHNYYCVSPTIRPTPKINPS